MPMSHLGGRKHTPFGCQGSLEWGVRRKSRRKGSRAGPFLTRPRPPGEGGGSSLQRGRGRQAAEEAAGYPPPSHRLLPRSPLQAEVNGGGLPRGGGGKVPGWIPANGAGGPPSPLPPQGGGVPGRRALAPVWTTSGRRAFMMSDPTPIAAPTRPRVPSDFCGIRGTFCEGGRST